MKNYLVIGGSSGIGHSLSQQLAADGHRVFATYYRHPPTSHLPGLSYHALNVNADEILLDFLPDILHGLVYTPGSILLKPFHRIPPEQFAADFQLQVGGAVRVLQAALPHLKQADQSSVVLFSTVAVRLGLPFHALVSASKGAVEGLTKALAAEWAPGIRVNAIAPSLTDTPLAAPLLNTAEKRTANELRHPLKRIGTPGDIASLTAFLLSDAASWITGQIIAADGGLSSLKV